MVNFFDDFTEWMCDFNSSLSLTSAYVLLRPYVIILANNIGLALKHCIIIKHYFGAKTEFSIFCRQQRKGVDTGDFVTGFRAYVFVGLVFFIHHFTTITREERM